MPAKQKIIQKRVQRKERFARMARLRYRKKNNVVATSEVLADIGKCTDESTLVHQYCPGIFFGERDGGIDCETSMLNKNYITNCINIIKEGDTKLVQLKLCKNTPKCDSPTSEELESWKQREHSEWSEWAERFKNFSTVYNNFLVKHDNKFKSGYLDEETAQRYKSYLQQRNQAMTTKHCVEIKTRFDLDEDYVSEIIYNSKYIDTLGYDVDEFVDKILREGIPRVKCAENDNGFLMSKIMDNFETLFERSLEFTMDQEPRLMTKDQILKTGNSVTVVSGYFLKKRAELSYLIILDDIKPLPENRTLIQSLHLPVVRNETSDKEDRRAFLEKYYKRQYLCLCCNAKEADAISTEEEEEIYGKPDFDNSKMTEELDKENQDEFSKNGYRDESKEESRKTISNIIISIPDRVRISRDTPCPSQVFQSPYRKLLQSYMFLFQNNSMNNTNY